MSGLPVTATQRSRRLGIVRETVVATVPLPSLPPSVWSARCVCGREFLHPVGLFGHGCEARDGLERVLAFMGRWFG